MSAARLPAVRVSLVRENGRGPYAPSRTETNTPAKAARLAAAVLPADADREGLAVLILDSRCRLAAVHLAALGSLNAARATPADLFRAAIIAGAAGIVLVHRHPSGDPEPSDDDIKFTETMIQAGGLLAVPVHDHIILGAAGFVSLRERGALAFA